jgi:hypothetical protein
MLTEPDARLCAAADGALALYAGVAFGVGQAPRARIVVARAS